MLKLKKTSKLNSNKLEEKITNERHQIFKKNQQSKSNKNRPNERSSKIPVSRNKIIFEAKKVHIHFFFSLSMFLDKRKRS